LGVKKVLVGRSERSLQSLSGKVGYGERFRSGTLKGEGARQEMLRKAGGTAATSGRGSRRRCSLVT